MSAEKARQIEARLRELTDAELAEEVRRLLGARLTAYVAATSSTQTVRAWIDRDLPMDPGARDRLAVAYRTAAFMAAADVPERVIQVWFQGVNPDLDDCAPARLLRSLGGHVADDVCAAARSFVAR